jgi:succinylglutamate desuccinylase
MHPIKRVLIVGGTHGNEFTGVYLIKKFQQFPHLTQQKGFEVHTLLANPQAYAIGRRYVDTDLNRCFQKSSLVDPNLTSYEAQQAKKIFQTFGTNGSLAADFVIDLHTTTSNMGLTIILSKKDSFNLRLAAYLTTKNHDIKILYSRPNNLENSHLDSICDFGCTVEIGAIAQGILNAKIFQKTEELVLMILDYIEVYSQDQFRPSKDTITIYQSTETVDFPRNETGDIQAMIHPNLQFKDYQVLNPGAAIFLTFDGKEIIYEGKSPVYPVFINEAAYYEKGIAMSITQKQQELLK